MKVTKDYLKQIILEELKASSLEEVQKNREIPQENYQTTIDKLSEIIRISQETVRDHLDKNSYQQFLKAIGPVMQFRDELKKKLTPPKPIDWGKGSIEKRRPEFDPSGEHAGTAPV